MNSKIKIAYPCFDRMEEKAVLDPIKSGWVTQGPYVEKFEKELARIHGVKYAVATTSCTTALHLALVALGVGPGDEVIVPSFTWIATANSVEYVGARPIFCDIDISTYNIDISKMERLITSRTRVVIPVHLFGLCADMERLTKICRKRKIHIVEDAACAIGASISGRHAGSFGDIGCFSFHPRKIITTGEGGMCTTNNEKIAKKLISLRNHGASISEEKRCKGREPYLLPDFNVLGFNYRMTDMQGAIGLAQISKLRKFLDGRKDWARWYEGQLKGIKWLKLPKTPDGFEHSYQSFVCLVDKDIAPFSRDKIMKKLHDKGIETRPGTHAVHMQAYYRKKYNLKPEDYPVSYYCNEQSLAIPLHNSMKASDYKCVAEALKGL